MKRRQFMAAACAGGLGALVATARAEQEPPNSGKEYYELRRYEFDSPAQRQRLVAFLGEAAVPAWNRLSIQPVGVFGHPEPEQLDLWVLLPHGSLESVATANARLLADREFLAAGAAVLDAPMSEPAYRRIESSLLVAFDQMPKLARPVQNEGRLFQLRTYESHGLKAGRKKVEMFNAGGEIAIFRRVGLAPVFFGQALVGVKLPCLTYMLGFGSKNASDEAWKQFLADPEWLKLKADPAYKDTVSGITNLFLTPAAASQI